MRSATIVALLFLTLSITRQYFRVMQWLQVWACSSAFCKGTFPYHTSAFSVSLAGVVDISDNFFGLLCPCIKVRSMIYACTCFMHSSAS